MKTHTIKIPTAELLIVQLPHRTADFSVINTGDRIAISAFDEYDACLEVHPISTDYTLLGKPSEIREEDARELVESFGRGKLKRFKGYRKKQFERTATESLRSAIESVIFWENPYSGVLALEFPSAFENIKLRTFDRSRSIILIKQ